MEKKQKQEFARKILGPPNRTMVPSGPEHSTHSPPHPILRDAEVYDAQAELLWFGDLYFALYGKHLARLAEKLAEPLYVIDRSKIGDAEVTEDMLVQDFEKVFRVAVPTPEPSQIPQSPPRADPLLAFGAAPPPFTGRAAMRRW